MRNKRKKKLCQNCGHEEGFHFGHAILNFEYEKRSSSRCEKLMRKGKAVFRCTCLEFKE